MSDAAKPAKPAKTPRKSAAKKTVSTVNVEQAPAAKVEQASAHRQIANPAHHEIAELAYHFWVARGRHHGHAEQDWSRAEQQLREDKS